MCESGLGLSRGTGLHGGDSQGMGGGLETWGRGHLVDLLLFASQNWLLCIVSHSAGEWEGLRLCVKMVGWGGWGGQAAEPVR